MHWTLDEVRALTLPEFNWVVEKLKEQKEREARAMRRRR